MSLRVCELMQVVIALAANATALDVENFAAALVSGDTKTAVRAAQQAVNDAVSAVRASSALLPYGPTRVARAAAASSALISAHGAAACVSSTGATQTSLLSPLRPSIRFSSCNVVLEFNLTHDLQWGPGVECYAQYAM